MALRELIEDQWIYWLVGILVLSLVIRVAVATFQGIPEESGRRYQFAQNLAEGRGFTGCTYFPMCKPGNDQTASVGPVPVLIYAAVIKTFGNNVKHLIAGLQIILAVITTSLLYLIILRLFNCRIVALIGTFLYALYPPAIIYSLQMRAETIFTFFLLISTLTLIYALSTRRPLHWVLTGVFLGLAAQSRVAFVYFPFILVLIIPLIATGSIKQRFLQSAILALTIALTLTPWVIRNAVVFHAFIPGGTLTGYNLYRANYMISQAEYLRWVSAPEGKTAVAQFLERIELRGDENEHEMDSIYRQEAIKIIQENPVQYLHLSAFRFFSLWAGTGVYFNNIGKLVVGIENVILLVLALMAAVRRGVIYPPAVGVILLLILYYTAGHMLVNAMLRYIAPIIPLVIALAADQLHFISTYFINHFKEGLINSR